jgi:hypothetical protein
MLRSIPVPFGMAAAGAALLASSRPLAEALSTSNHPLTIAAFTAGAVLFATGLSMVAVETADRALWMRRDPERRKTRLPRWRGVRRTA